MDSKLLIHSTKTTSFSSIQHCTSQLQSKYCRRQITVLRPFNTKRVQRNTACKKCCKVKHNSESVFHYFASAENSNYMLSVVIQALKKPVMFLCTLCTPFENRCLMYSGWAFEITHLAYTNYHHLITVVSIIKSLRLYKLPNLIPI